MEKVAVGNNTVYLKDLQTLEGKNCLTDPVRDFLIIRITMRKLHVHVLNDKHILQHFDKLNDLGVFQQIIHAHLGLIARQFNALSSWSVRVAFFSCNKLDG